MTLRLWSSTSSVLPAWGIKMRKQSVLQGRCRCASARVCQGAISLGCPDAGSCRAGHRQGTVAPVCGHPRQCRCRGQAGHCPGEAAGDCVSALPGWASASLHPSCHVCCVPDGQNVGPPKMWLPAHWSVALHALCMSLKASCQPSPMHSQWVCPKLGKHHSRWCLPTLPACHGWGHHDFVLPTAHISWAVAGSCGLACLALPPWN